MNKLKIAFSILVVLVAIYLLKKNHVNQLFVVQKSKINLEFYPKTLDSIKLIKKKLIGKSTGIIGKEFVDVLTNKIFPYWYGTDWDFNGTTQKPNEGKIACGYFVTTTLQQVGLDLNRVKLAQCASEVMITTIVSKENVYRFSNKTIKDFEKSLKKIGNGIYIVGLDNHTGFVLISNERNYFIHSSGIPPHQVVKDKLSESSLIVNSKYRVVGSLSADKKLLSNWTKN